MFLQRGVAIAAICICVIGCDRSHDDDSTAPSSTHENVYAGMKFTPNPHASIAPIATDAASATDVPTKAPTVKPVAKGSNGIHDGKISITAAMMADDFDTASNLYDEASGIVADTPQSSMEAAQMVNGHDGPAGQFYDQDRAYQDHLGKQSPFSSNGRGRAMLDLSEFETFVYESVATSVASCNEHGGADNLRVAKAFLAEAHRDVAGTESEDWEPPQIEEDGTAQCSGE